MIFEQSTFDTLRCFSSFIEVFLVFAVVIFIFSLAMYVGKKILDNAIDKFIHRSQQTYITMEECRKYREKCKERAKQKEKVYWHLLYDKKRKKPFLDIFRNNDKD